MPKATRTIIGTIVTQQSGQVPYRHLCHTGGINGQLDHLGQGIGCHVPLQLPGQDGPGVGVHHGDHVVVAHTDHPEIRGIGSLPLMCTAGLALVLFASKKLHIGRIDQPFPFQEAKHRRLTRR